MRVNNQQEHFPIKGADIALPFIQNCGFNNWHRASQLQWHEHSAIELLILIEGTAAYEFSDGVVVSLVGGEFFFCTTGMSHRGAMGINEPSKMVWIVFDPVLDSACENSTMTARDLAYIAQQCRQVDRQVLSYSKRMSRLLNEYRELVARCVRRQLSTTHAIQLRSLICTIVAESVASLNDDSENIISPAVQELQNRLDEDFSETINIAEIAAGHNISRTYLYSIFRQATGHTPNDYLQRVRVREAQKLLSGTDKSATDVAFLTGFNSSQYFSNVFRKYVGVSPLVYRQQTHAIANEKIPGCVPTVRDQRQAISSPATYVA